MSLTAQEKLQLLHIEWQSLNEKHKIAVQKRDRSQDYPEIDHLEAVKEVDRLWNEIQVIIGKIKLINPPLAAW